VEKANMKALRIEKSMPYSFVLADENPPNLIINIASQLADLSRLNCFVAEGCDLIRDERSVTIKAKKTLTKRRTLYTITAPPGRVKAGIGSATYGYIRRYLNKYLYPIVPNNHA
jgi:hypothetical protein